MLFGGGVAADGRPSDAVFILNAESQRWHYSHLGEARFALAAAATCDIAAFGGGFGYLLSARVDVFDFTNGRATGSSLSAARCGLAAASTGDLIFFAGGGKDQNNTFDTVDILDTKSKTWRTSTLSTPRTMLCGCGVRDKVLFAGGIQGQSILDTVDIFSLSTNDWTKEAMSVPRHWFAAAATETEAFFAGGSVGSKNTDVVDIYNALTGQWSTANLSQPRAGLAATRSGKYVLFVGGYTLDEAGKGSPSNVVDVFDTESRRWHHFQLTTGRGNPSCAGWNERVCVFGGDPVNDGSNHYCSVAEVIEPPFTSTVATDLSTIAVSRDEVLRTSSENELKELRIRQRKAQILSFESILQTYIDILGDALERSAGKQQLSNAYFHSTDEKPISVSSLSLQYEQLPVSLQTRLLELAIALNASKDFRFAEVGHSPPLRPSLVDCMLAGVYDSYILGCLAHQSPVTAKCLLPFLSFQVSDIHSWLARDGSTAVAVVQILPRAEVPIGFRIGSWEHFEPDRLDLALATERRSIHSSPAQITMQIAQSSWFRCKVAGASDEDATSRVLELAQDLLLAVCIGLRAQFTLADVNVELWPWRHAPDKNPLQVLRFDQPRVDPWRAQQIQFSSQIQLFAEGKAKSPFDPEPSDRLVATQRWFGILEANPPARFSLARIQRGLWATAEAPHLPFFSKELTALQGIYDCLSGMDGLIVNCKPQRRNRSKRTFSECWSAVWHRRLAMPDCSPLLRRVADPSSAIETLYVLRSSIAHSDPSELTATIRNAKQSLGNWLNPKDDDACSFAPYLLPVVNELLAVFEAAPQVLTGMLNGVKPTAQ